jgi:2,4-dienoyl-CoA reductase-like NADH-dependent reductase (Old Yellow Enzyme family)
LKKIFESVELCNLNPKNRLFRSATWDGLARPDGTLPDDVYDIYRELAKGGIGVIITGLTDVSPYNWALVGNTRLCSDNLISDYKRLTDIVHEYDCKILVQLNMDEYVRADRKLAAVPIDDLTQEDIIDIVGLFSDAAIRAEKSNFDGVQLHLAYSWLLNRFINPQYNHRTDQYGGTTKNRVRIVLEIMKAIRENTSNLHIGTKFSFFDDSSGNFAVAECKEICRLLSDAGIDSIEILGGHSPKEKGTKYEACYLHLALAAKEVSAAPVILTGNNHDVDNMETLLNKQGIEFFALSRPLIREPDLPNRWQKEDRSKAKCISCSQCYTTYGKRCIFNS